MAHVLYLFIEVMYVMCNIVQSNLQFSESFVPDQCLCENLKTDFAVNERSIE